MKKKYILGIIPARSGSKRLPGKNIKILNGKPLISYIINTALKVKLLDNVIISTDSKKIAEVAKKYGASVPFMRPEKYANIRIIFLITAIKYLSEENIMV